MAPPVSVSQSCRGAPAVAPGTNRPDVLPSSTTIAPSGRVAPTAAARDSAERGPAGRLGPFRRCRAAPVRRRAHRLGQRLQGAGRVLAGTGQRVHGAARRDQVARLVRVGEEGHRGLGVHQDQVAHAVELGLGHLGQVGQPLHGGDARPRVPGWPGRSRPAARRRSPRRPCWRRAARRPGASCHPSATPPARPSAGPWPPRRPCRPAPRTGGRVAVGGTGRWRTRTTTSPPAGPGWRRSRAAPARRRRTPRRPRPRRRPGRSSGTSPRRRRRWTRCRTGAVRRSGRGTWRGRRRC